MSPPNPDRPRPDDAKAHDSNADDGLNGRIDAWLRAGAGGARPCQQVIETSISCIFLFEDRALKLKKPVNFGFVDFTSLPKRRWAIDRELAFNRLTAPDIYRAVHAITLGRDGSLEWDGPGAVVDLALEMRRFSDDSLLSRREPADAALGEALGREIARVHRVSPPILAGEGGAAGLAYVIQSNAGQLRAFAGALGADAVEDLIAAAQASLAQTAGLLDARFAAGFCRPCHGDLHAGNIIIEAGVPILFDAIEFNDRLREIDILYDLAFLLMDLKFHGAPAAANRALNGWTDAMARERGEDLYAGLAALPLFQSTRAAVRAHVSAREGKFGEARLYLDAARAYLKTHPPRLMAVGGLSGSGKTTFARGAAPAMGAAPGAVVLRSDEIRKRLWGAQPLGRLPPAAYEPSASARVYETLAETARACLTAGHAVIADAVFLEPTHRAMIEAVAREVSAPFEGVWLETAPDTARARLTARAGDASDADARVLAAQMLRETGEIRWRRERLS
jgi:aminoglycoside phosphotransferase family enzyme/predicted kinase